MVSRAFKVCRGMIYRASTGSGFRAYGHHRGLHISAGRVGKHIVKSRL